jgi:hypothetical protein
MSRSCRFFVVALAVMLFGAPLFAAGRSCATAAIAEPFALPDGSRHDAGKLTICVDYPQSPVSYLHPTYVNGSPVGRFSGSREVLGMGDSNQAFMLFERDSGQLLHLSGLGVPARSNVEFYRFDFIKVEVSSSIRAAATPARGSVTVVAAGA